MTANEKKQKTQIVGLLYKIQRRQISGPISPKFDRLQLARVIPHKGCAPQELDIWYFLAQKCTTIKAQGQGLGTIQPSERRSNYSRPASQDRIPPVLSGPVCVALSPLPQHGACPPVPLLTRPVFAPPPWVHSDLNSHWHHTHFGGSFLHLKNVRNSKFSLRVFDRIWSVWVINSNPGPAWHSKSHVCYFGNLTIELGVTLPEYTYNYMYQ